MSLLLQRLMSNLSLSLSQLLFAFSVYDKIKDCVMTQFHVSIFKENPLTLTVSKHEWFSDSCGQQSRHEINHCNAAALFPPEANKDSPPFLKRFSISGNQRPVCGWQIHWASWRVQTSFCSYDLQMERRELSFLRLVISVSLRQDGKPGASVGADLSWRLDWVQCNVSAQIWLCDKKTSIRQCAVDSIMIFGSRKSTERFAFPF